jgi:hypothetical protein
MAINASFVELTGYSLNAYAAQKMKVSFWRADSDFLE